jgi:hypothetical protein
MAAMTKQYVIEIERDKRMLGALTLLLTYLFKLEAIEGSSIGLIVVTSLRQRPHNTRLEGYRNGE